MRCPKSAQLTVISIATPRAVLSTGSKPAPKAEQVPANKDTSRGWVSQCTVTKGILVCCVLVPTKIQKMFTQLPSKVKGCGF